MLRIFEFSLEFPFARSLASLTLTSDVGFLAMVARILLRLSEDRNSRP